MTRLARLWRRVAYCAQGEHRETIVTTAHCAAHFSLADGLAVTAFGWLGYHCSDCGAVRTLGEYRTGNTNRHVGERREWDA